MSCRGRKSVCPECLETIPAERVMRGEDIFLRKTCRKHGAFETIVWRGAPSHAGWARPKVPTYPRNPATPIDEGCPRDCGLCPDHRQQTCCTLIEVTQNAATSDAASVFAGADGALSEDPDMGEIRRAFETLLNAGGPYNVQISGGEPTLREDLSEIIRLGGLPGLRVLAAEYQRAPPGGGLFIRLQAQGGGALVRLSPVRRCDGLRLCKAAGTAPFRSEENGRWITVRRQIWE